MLIWLLNLQNYCVYCRAAFCQSSWLRVSCLAGLAFGLYYSIAYFGIACYMDNQQDNLHGTCRLGFECSFDESGPKGENEN